MLQSQQKQLLRFSNLIGRIINFVDGKVALERNNLQNLGLGPLKCRANWNLIWPEVWPEIDLMLLSLKADFLTTTQGDLFIQLRVIYEIILLHTFKIFFFNFQTFCSLFQGQTCHVWNNHDIHRIHRIGIFFLTLAGIDPGPSRTGDGYTNHSPKV